MLAIHGLWLDGVLRLWAESAERAARPARQRPGGAAAPYDHPFAADPGLLGDVLTEFGDPVGELVTKATEGESVLWLPGGWRSPRAAGPAAAVLATAASLTAPGLATGPRLATAPGPATAVGLASGRAASGRAGLAAWRVRVLCFEPAAALTLLAAVSQPGMRPGRGAVGGSVSYLAAVADLAADLAARGRVLPGLVQFPDGGYAACWRPVLAGPDALRGRELAGAVPPVCRATSPAGEPSATVFGQALDALTDAAVRTRLNRQPGFSLVPARAARVGRSAGSSRGTGPPEQLTRHWLAALTGYDGRLRVSPGEQPAAAQLAFALWGWHDAAQLPPGPVRTCFRLVEPPAPAGDGEPEAGWRVEFALQSADDPSLLLPAPDIWAGDTADGWLAAGVAHPEEELLAGLGRASRMFPEVDRELDSPAPAAVELDTRGALRFLSETGPMLAGAGFGVLLPDWARKSRLGLKLTTRSRAGAAAGQSAGAARFRLDDLVDFSYQVAVGGQVLSPGELAELARLKVPLVRLRGQWVELDERHLQAALKFLERRGSGTMTAGQAVLAGLGEEDDLPVTEVDADGWLADLLCGDPEHRLVPLRTPATFDGQLRPYQERGLSWLAFLSQAGLGAILADDMGLGKTAQTLALLAHERDAGRVAGPTLLVCPMSLVGNWQREAARFAPGLTVHVHHGADRLAGDDLAAALDGADLVITTYGLAARDLAELTGARWARVICDEAQNIKNAGTRQARAVRAIPALSRIALTGTPVENRLSDLWSLLSFALPGMLGSAEKFRRRFAIPIERSADEEAARQLRRITRPFILRRLKTDKAIIADLPDKLEMKVWCNLTSEQASLYQATVDDMLARIEAAEPGVERRGLVLATMAKLKQACNHPAHLLGDGSRLDGRSGKLARLEEIAEEIVAAGDRALCFTQYAEFGRMLQPYLAARLGCEVYFLHGGTPKTRRDQMVAAFQEGNDPSLFLLSLKAGGTGLNLTAASHVIHVDRWWNPAVEDQATDRAFRIGQRRDVQVRKFVCVGTVEERIDAMIEEKKALAEAIVGTGEGWLTELSVADLRRVIELSPEAVSA